MTIPDVFLATLAVGCVIASAVSVGIAVHEWIRGEDT